MKKQDINERQADATGIAASARAATDGRPYLGDYEVVDGLVRALAAEVFGRYVQVSKGEITPDDAASGDQEACHQLARTLIGENENYAPVPVWTDTGLAESLRQQHPEALHDEDDVSVVAQVVAMFVHQLYGVIGQIPEGGDGSESQETINELIRSFVWLLLGMRHG